MKREKRKRVRMTCAGLYFTVHAKRLYPRPWWNVAWLRLRAIARSKS
jgi:hypothetical protein